MEKEFNILVVDDDADDRKLFCRSLKQTKAEYGCLMANNGQEGIDFLKNNFVKPKIAFVDINMPLMTGWQFLTAINADPALKDLEVIIFSTSSNQRDVGIANDLGASGYCIKPDDPVELKNVIKYIVENIQAHSPNISDYTYLFKFFRFRNN